MEIVSYEPYFEKVAEHFTECVLHAANWRENYQGASTSDKLKQAIDDLKFAVFAVERCHEMKDTI